MEGCECVAIHTVDQARVRWGSMQCLTYGVLDVGTTACFVASCNVHGEGTPREESAYI